MRCCFLLWLSAAAAAAAAVQGQFSGQRCRSSVFVRWPGVRLNFRAVAAGRLSLRACQSACSLGEDPVVAGKSLECAAINHQTAADNFDHHCEVFQPHQLQNVDGFVEADDRFSFYWKYCVDSTKKCGGDHAFTFLSDRYMDTAEVQEVRLTSSLEECLSDCLNEEKFQCRSLSFNRTDGGCHLSTNNQLTKPQAIKLNNNPNFRIDYYENNCYNMSDSYKFRYECKEDGVAVTVDSKYPYTGALYGLYDFFTCRVEPKEQTQFDFFFPFPTVSKKCSDSIRYKGNDMLLDIVLSTDGVEPLYFITPDDMTFQARCPIRQLTDEPQHSVNTFPEAPASVNDVTADEFAASAHALFSLLSKESIKEEIPILSAEGPARTTNLPISAKTFTPSPSVRPTTPLAAAKDTFSLANTERTTPPSSMSTARPATTTTTTATTTTTSTASTSSTTSTTTRPNTSTTRSAATTTPPRRPATSTSTARTTMMTTAKPTAKQTATTTVATTQKPAPTASSASPEIPDHHWSGGNHLARAPTKAVTSTTTAGPPGADTTHPAIRQPVIFDIFHNGRPVEAVVVGSRITLDFTPHYPVSPRYMSVRGCQVEPIDPRYDWEREPLPIIRDGCPADFVGLACPPQATDHGLKVSIEAFRYQTTAHVQYTCLVRVCPFAECPQTECPAIDGCESRAKRSLSLDEIRRALEADPNLQRQIGLPAFIGHPAISTEQQLLALAGDHVVKRRLVVVNSEDQLRYYVRTGETQ